jgi:hypothetical protein
MSHGDIYLADLNPSRDSEQAGIRPVVNPSRDFLCYLLIADRIKYNSVFDNSQPNMLRLPN